MRLFTTTGSLLAAFTALLCACGSAAPAKHPPAAATADSSCPVAVPGTSVAVEDTATGAALVFVTTGDVVELRRRVGAMATMHNEHHAKMAGMDHAAGGMNGMKDMKMAPAVASAEDVAGGARIVLVAAPADVPAVQEQARMHAKMMEGGTCMMMGAH